jgi:hypothetical protein
VWWRGPWGPSCEPCNLPPNTVTLLMELDRSKPHRVTLLSVNLPNATNPNYSFSTCSCTPPKMEVTYTEKRSALS